MFFRVKYYVENVNQLQLGHTRHLYYLQLCKDVLGRKFSRKGHDLYFSLSQRENFIATSSLHLNLLPSAYKLRLEIKRIQMLSCTFMLKTVYHLEQVPIVVMIL